jgi:uncharacterized protein YndB with AHSA1/START domain
MNQIISSSKMDTQPVIVERVFDVPVQKVWEALTEIEQMKQWYFDLPDFKAREGFEFQFYGGKNENKQYLHLCKVTDIVPGKMLAYTWRYDGYPGISKVSFELSREGNSTRLRLTHSGLETFGSSNPDFAKEEFTVGWTLFLNDALSEYLSNLTS